MKNKSRNVRALTLPIPLQKVLPLLLLSLWFAILPSSWLATHIIHHLIIEVLVEVVVREVRRRHQARRSAVDVNLGNIGSIERVTRYRWWRKNRLSLRSIRILLCLLRRFRRRCWFTCILCFPLTFGSASRSRCPSFPRGGRWRTSHFLLFSF